MELERIKHYANVCASIMDTALDEIFEEEQESDAGFSLENGYNLQIAPYNPEGKFILSFWDDECLYNIAIVNTWAELVKKVAEEAENPRQQKSTIGGSDAVNLSDTANGGN